MKNLFIKINALTMSLILTLAIASCQNSTGNGEKLSVDEFEKLLSTSKSAQLIDVRTPDEFESGHLKDAINININSADFDQKINALLKEKPVFVYCLSGGRSSKAASIMKSKGIKTVYEMPGIISWRNAGKPLVTGNVATIKNGMTADDYQKFVTDSKFVLVDFNAVWCMPCKKLAPILDKIASDKKDKLIVKKVDADENPELLKQKGIDGIPYLELYKDGKLVWKHAGFIDEQTLLSETKL
jgi:thioredoxin 1